MKQEKEKSVEIAFSVRTDLAIEARELAQSDAAEADELEGVEVETEEQKDYSLTHVRILSDAGSQRMGKPMGNYITLESEKLKENDVECHEKLIALLAENIRSLVKLKKDDCILVAGLGNWNITPDALGPKVVSKILVTRHLQGSLPEEINAAVRPVAAISPGVMGITGIETGEIIKGIVEKLRPSLLIAIDALAARSCERLAATVQLSDSGINPGSGIGNNRKAICRETVGVPVIAPGVPTVVNSATLVYDALRQAGIEEIRPELHRVLENGRSFFVSPKESDVITDKISELIADAVDTAFTLV